MNMYGQLIKVFQKSFQVSINTEKKNRVDQDYISIMRCHAITVVRRILAKHVGI